MKNLRKLSFIAILSILGVIGFSGKWFTDSDSSNTLVRQVDITKENYLDHFADNVIYDELDGWL